MFATVLTTIFGFTLNSAHASFDMAMRDCHITPVQSSAGDVELLLRFTKGKSLGSIKLSQSEMALIRSRVNGRKAVELDRDGGTVPLTEALQLSRSGDSYMLEQLDGSGESVAYRRIMFDRNPTDLRRFRILSVFVELGPKDGSDFGRYVCRFD